MIAGLEAAHTTPQPSARIAAIVQASVFDALNGIERRYTPYHVDANAPRGASRAAAVASAAYTALVALIPSEKPLFDQQIAATLAQISDDPANPADRRGRDGDIAIRAAAKDDRIFIEHQAMARMGAFTNHQMRHETTSGSPTPVGQAETKTGYLRTLIGGNSSRRRLLSQPLLLYVRQRGA